MDEFKPLFNSYFNLLSRIAIIIVVLSSFFLFTNLTTEFYDTAKFLILLLATGFLLILIGIKFALNNKVVFIRTPLDIPLLLLLVVGIASTFLSPAPLISILGNQLKVNGSLVSLAVYVLFYFMLVNHLKGSKDVKGIFTVATMAGVVLSIITLLAYLGFKVLPSPWTHGVNFTPTGSSFSTTAILTLMLPFVVLQILSATNLTVKIISSVMFALFGIIIVLTGSWPIWIAAILGLILTFLVSPLGKIRQINQVNPITLIPLLTPLVLVILVVLLSFVPPIGGAKNPLYEKSKNFPAEVSLSLTPSWKTSISAFRDSPFWGSGPSTYLFDFTNYKPIEVNNTKLWNIRFDSAFNEYLQILATLGGVGLIAFLSLTALFISSAYSLIASPLTEESRVANHELKQALAISGLLFFVILALHPATLALWVFGLLILASFYVINLSDNSSKSWSVGGNIQHTLYKFASNITSVTSSKETIDLEALPSVLLTIILGIVLFTFFFAGKIALADYHHRLALNAVSANQGIIAYNELIVSEKLNPWTDLYRTDLAQTNFALANAIASAKAPTPASPAGSLTDQDKQNIQVLLQQSINEGKAAVALSPRSALDWEILGLLYRQIAGVAQNALVFSLDSYGRAIFQDPLNPLLRLSVGGVYYAVQNYDLAIRFFTDAINLKPDFANGYYNLSVALRDKGDLTNAQAAAEKVLTLVDKNSSDYKLATDYLNDLKSKANKTQEPPASKTTGSLQQKELPKVVNVGNPPEKIATPPAVKKTEPTPTPTP